MSHFKPANRSPKVPPTSRTIDGAAGARLTYSTEYFSTGTEIWHLTSLFEEVLPLLEEFMAKRGATIEELLVRVIESKQDIAAIQESVHSLSVEDVTKLPGRIAALTLYPPNVTYPTIVIDRGFALLDETFESDRRMQTLFHECGHAMSFLLRPQGLRNGVENFELLALLIADEYTADLVSIDLWHESDRTRDRDVSFDNIVAHFFNLAKGIVVASQTELESPSSGGRISLNQAVIRQTLGGLTHAAALSGRDALPGTILSDQADLTIRRLWEPLYTYFTETADPLYGGDWGEYSEQLKAIAREAVLPTGPAADAEIP